MVRTNPNATEFVLGVNAFYGENMAGIWKLHLTDYVSDSTGGELNSFRIKIYGN
jgi:subtilisin-like proprotein convertase family protein